MLKVLNGKSNIIELLTPAQDDPEFEQKLEVFGERAQRILDSGAAVSIPDNPMGRLRFNALEVLEHLGLSAGQDILVHLNTFHTKTDIDERLRAAADQGIRHLFIVSGDGNPRLPKLEPEDLGVRSKVVTSVELLGYVHAQYPGVFSCGVCFNHYEPEEHEALKLSRKLEAGAEFVITQPVVGADRRMDALVAGPVPLFVEAWMSRKIELVWDCVGSVPPGAADAGPYSPVDNLHELRRLYPSAGLYLALLSFKSDWSGFLPTVARLESA